MNGEKYFYVLMVLLSGFVLGTYATRPDDVSILRWTITSMFGIFFLLMSIKD